MFISTCTILGLSAWSLGLLDGPFISPSLPLFGAEEASSRFMLRSQSSQNRQLGGYNMSSGFELPAWTDNMLDVSERAVRPNSQLNMFWHIGRSGGQTLEKVFTWCMDRRVASDSSEVADIDGSTNIQLTQREYNASDILGPFIPTYVNVHTNTKEWIDEIKSRNLLDAKQTDLMFTQHLEYAVTTIFEGTGKKARVSTMFRHPVKRIVDQFYYRQHATWKDSYDINSAKMSLEKFSSSQYLIENYYVRSLNSLTSTEPVTKHHVDVAKEIIRTKMLVSIFEWFEVGVVRIEKWYNWWKTMDVLNNRTINHCHYEIIEKSDHAGSGPRVPTGEEVYHRILIRNWADMELYFYAKNVFPDQRSVVDGLFGV